MKIKILCPKCSYEPKDSDRWQCKCLFVWNTFDTGGKCPKCGYQWQDTACPSCHKWSPHLDWYKITDDVSDSESIKSKEKLKDKVLI